MKSMTLIMLMAFTATTAFTQTEEAAIKAVLTRETNAFFKHDFKAAYAEWHVIPQSTGIVSSPDGTALYLTSKELNAPYATKELHATVFPDSFTRSNWNFRINATDAYVTFNQTTMKGKEITGKTYESRYMEKVNGQWKIVSMTVVNNKQ